MLLRPEESTKGSKGGPVIVSLIAHLSVLALVAFGPPVSKKEPSAYQQLIAPHEKKLVWYRFDKKLPEVSPPKKEAAARPPRVEVKRPGQTIVSKSPRREVAEQTIITPGPELKIDKDVPAPNLLAFAMPKLPDPPPQPKVFTPPPPEAPRVEEQPKLEKGPELAASEPPKVMEQMPIVPKPAAKPFVPPPKIARQVETPQVEPVDPRIDPTPKSPVLLAQVPAPPRPQPRAFTPPPAASKPGVGAAPALPGKGPEVAGSTLQVPVQIPLPGRPQPKAFAAPSPKATAAAAPNLDGPPSDLTAAVVGLNPIDQVTPVIPEGSRPAQFSAAPEISPKDGAGGTAESPSIVMPDLLIRGASKKKESMATLARVAPTSRENLLAAGGKPIITNTPAAPESAPAKPMLGAVRVSGSPDPHFEGRTVFTVALQMPNVTSYSGSWILWYAERKGPPGETPDIAAPSPLRKVDPVYDLSAVEDRIEGKVQLSAVIHTDGYVYGINVMKGVDARLDNSAVAALRKWEFEPARRDGTPVDVDVVIEIPFRLSPPKKK